MAHIILYDGVCGLCNRANRFVLARDRFDRFRFAPLQGRLAREVLARHGRTPDDLDTLYVVLDLEGPAERVVERGAAWLSILGELGPPWSWARALAWLPRGILDLFYDGVARSRYRVFGRLEVCPIPPLEHLAKFVFDAE